MLVKPLLQSRFPPGLFSGYTSMQPEYIEERFKQAVYFDLITAFSFYDDRVVFHFISSFIYIAQYC